jgi:hypothetical protein
MPYLNSCSMLPAAGPNAPRKECGATENRAAPGGKTGVPACANGRERAVPPRAWWNGLAGLGFAKSANFGTVSRAKRTVGTQAAHLENYFR